MNEHRFGRIADRRAGGFRIENNLLRHIAVGTRIDKDVAVARTRFDHRHRCILHHRSNQALAATGNEQIQIALEGHHFLRTGSLGILHQANAVSGKSLPFQHVPNQGYQRFIGVNGLFSATQNGRIARF